MNDLSTIREALVLATMKDSATTTKQYRLEAIANKLRSALSRLEASAGEPVGWQFFQDGEWHYGDDRIRNHRKNTEEGGYPVRDLYAHPSPSPAPVELSEADIDRMVTEAVPGFAIGFAKELVRHIIKHYTLYPKQP